MQKAAQWRCTQFYFYSFRQQVQRKEKGNRVTNLLWGIFWSGDSASRNFKTTIGIGGGGGADYQTNLAATYCPAIRSKHTGMNKKQTSK
jgi:hypothetical protein